MITSDIIERVFFIRNTTDTATCFSIKINGKIHFITAKHFLQSEGTIGWIEISHENQWKRLELKDIKHSPTSDISVFKIDWEADVHPVVTESKGLVYSQYVYFLGFPNGKYMYHKELNRGFPMPLVKGGIISGMFMLDKGAPFLIDGHNNKGFSGGPVVFKNEFTGLLQIAG